MKDAAFEKTHPIRALMSDADPTCQPEPERGDPTWVAPALTPEEQTRHVGKTPIFFGPPLAILTAGQKNTMEISGKLNRTAERYLELLRYHGLELSEPERQCIAHICQHRLHVAAGDPRTAAGGQPDPVRVRGPGQGGAGCRSWRRPASPTSSRSSSRWASEGRCRMPCPLTYCR